MPLQPTSNLVCLDDKLYLALCRHHYLTTSQSISAKCGYLGNRNTQKEVLLLCLDTYSGRTHWSQETDRPISQVLATKVARRHWLAYATFDDQGTYWYKRNPEGKTVPVGATLKQIERIYNHKSLLINVRGNNDTALLARVSSSQGGAILSAEEPILFAKEIEILAACQQAQRTCLITLINHSSAEPTLICHRLPNFETIWEINSKELVEANFEITDEKISIYKDAKLRHVFDVESGLQRNKSS